MPFNDYDRPADRTEYVFWAILFLFLAGCLLMLAPSWPFIIVGAIAGCAGLYFAAKVLLT